MRWMASCLAVLFWVSAVEAGTYAPQEGQPGTTAISPFK
jgi:hypothetical protein